MNLLTIESIYTVLSTINTLLTVKELLKHINYEFNELYFDKFWDSIKENLSIYIDNNMLIWMGYNCIEIKDSKKKYIILLKENFEEGNEYKIMNNKEFKDITLGTLMSLEKININTHNKTQHLIVSHDCFKQSLMMLRTNKAKEIKKYYIELEKIFKFYLEYQNQYQQLQNQKMQDELQNKDNELKEINKNQSIMSDSMILSYKGKTVLYIARIGPNLIKFGISNKIGTRNDTHKKNFELFEFIYITICYNNLEVENSLKEYAKINNKLISKVINGHNYTELITIDNEFTIDMILQKVKKECNNQYSFDDLQKSYQKVINDKEKLYTAYIEIQNNNKELNEKIIKLEQDNKNLETLNHNIKKLEKNNKELNSKIEDLSLDLTVFKIANKSLIYELNNINNNKSNIRVDTKEETKQDVKQEVKEDIREDIREDVTQEVKQKVKEDIREDVKPNVEEEVEKETKPNIKHKQNKKFTCTRCEESFTTNMSLTKHLNKQVQCKDVNEVIKYECTKCNKEFKCQASLNRHLSDKRKYSCDQPKEKKTYTCEKCNKFFEKKGRYNEHLRKQTKCDMDLRCKKCNHKFTTVYNYNLHINSKISCV